jgi:hypothetical protein
MAAGRSVNFQNNHRESKILTALDVVNNGVDTWRGDACWRGKQEIGTKWHIRSRWEMFFLRKFIIH